MKKWRELKKIFALGAVATLLGVTVIGCGSSSTEEASEPATQADETIVTEESEAEEENETEELKVVRVVGSGVDTSGVATLVGNAYVAREQGFFDEELEAIGYTIEYSGFQNAGVGANEALAANEADIAIYGDFPALTYIATGNDAKIFAVSTNRNQIGIFANEDINSVEDLKGKKVNTMFGTVAYQYLVQVLEENGLSLDDIEVINASPVDATSLYTSGEIDAIVNGPQATWPLIAQGLGHQVAVNGDSESLSNCQVVMGRTEFLEENPEVAAAIVRALKKAQDYAKENEEEVYQSLADNSGNLYTVDNWKEYYSFENGFEDYSPYITDSIVEHLQKTADFMKSNEYIASDINIEDYIDDSNQAE
ncbi:MAG: aliphatic sulfonate ABC transporter substrate-binding protein [Lachnospiraceae bacterium]